MISSWKSSLKSWAKRSTSISINRNRNEFFNGDDFHIWLFDMNHFFNWDRVDNVVIDSSNLSACLCGMNNRLGGDSLSWLLLESNLRVVIFDDSLNYGLVNNLSSRHWDNLISHSVLDLRLLNDRFVVDDSVWLSLNLYIDSLLLDNRLHNSLMVNLGAGHWDDFCLVDHLSLSRQHIRLVSLYLRSPLLHSNVFFLN